MLRIIDQKTGKAISLKEQEKLCANDRNQNIGTLYDKTKKRVLKGSPVVIGGLTQPKVEAAKSKKVETK